MMNIIEVQDNLKNFSEDQLVSEMQAPSGMIPQFLVLSELNRRKRVKDDFAARSAENQNTVAQEAIAASGMPQEGLPEMARSMAPKSASALSQPVERMAAGGLAMFGSNIANTLSNRQREEEINPFLDEVTDLAESRFDIELPDTPMPIRPIQPPVQQPQPMPFPMTPPQVRPQPFPSPVIGPPIRFPQMPRPVGIGGKGRPRPPRMPGGVGRILGTARPYAEGGLLGAYNQDMDFSNMSEEEMIEFIQKMRDLSAPVKMEKGGTLGIRQNNPGNIRPGAGFFGETGVGSGYATFKNPIYGGRALARLLSTYKNKHNINNIRGLINRYAPSGDNTPASRKNYVSYLAGKLGVSEDTEIDLDDDNTKMAVMKGIVEFENANKNPYTDQDYNLMIQSAKIDDESEANKLIESNTSGSASDGGLGLISKAVAGPNSKTQNSKKDERSFLDRLINPKQDKDSMKMVTGSSLSEKEQKGKKDLKETLIGSDPYEFYEKDDKMGSSLPKPLTSYKDLLNLEAGSRAEQGFIDPQEVFGGDQVYGEGPIITQDGKKFVKTKRNGKEILAELDKKGNIKVDKKGKDVTKKVETYKAVPTGDPFKRPDLEQDIIDLQKQLQKDRDVEKWLAIAKTGLAIADPTKTLSEAAESGIDAMTEARKRYTEGVIDLINARSKLLKAGKTGLKIDQLFTNLDRNRKLQQKYSDVGITPNKELLDKLKAEEIAILDEISTRYPAFALPSRASTQSEAG